MAALIQQGMISVKPKFIIALPDPDRVSITDCATWLYVSADPDNEEGYDAEKFDACEQFSVE